jgi:flagellar motor switch protein FliN/FliY
MSDLMNRYGALPLSLEAELGRCSMPVREIVSLGPGSVIRLSTAVGSEVDVRVGGAPFGAAEIVKAGRKVALRLTNFRTAKGQ